MYVGTVPDIPNMHNVFHQSGLDESSGQNSAARTVRATAAAVGPGAVRRAWGGLVLGREWVWEISEIILILLK